MKLTKRDTVLLAVIGIIAVLGGGFWFVVKPAKAELSSQREQLTQIEDETAGLSDTIARMSGTQKGAARRTAERLRLAKALPDEVEAPGVVIQLQRLADRSNVELTSIKTNSFTDYGSIRGTEFEVRISGRFFDVDDFLYRLHRQVAVDEDDRPIVGGRLFATTSVDLTLDEGEIRPDGGISDDDTVVGTVKVVAFSAVPGGAAGATTTTTPVPTTAVASPAPATGTTSNEPTTSAGSGSGAAQATATPSTGGTP